jgi:hypothetical protein
MGALLLPGVYTSRYFAFPGRVPTHTHTQMKRAWSFCVCLYANSLSLGSFSSYSLWMGVDGEKIKKSLGFVLVPSEGCRRAA